MTLKERVTALATELEQPVFRIALATGDFDEGRHNGEDSERQKIAEQLRVILKESESE